MTAPDLRSLWITGLLLFAMASRCSLSPLVVAKPSWSILTFTVTGTPPSGPASSPRPMAASTAAACASTSSGLWSTTALILGLTASSRASAAVAASFAETFFDLTSEAISAADRRHRSCMQNSISIGALVAPGTGQCQRVGRPDLAHAGDEIGEIGDLLRRDRRHHVSHAGVIAVAAVVLVFGKGLGEIVLALVGDARDVFLAGQIGVMAGVAAVLLHQRLAALQPRGITGVRGWRRLRQLGDEIGKEAKIVVGQRLRHLVHRLEGAQLLAEHEKLDQRVRRLLRTE